MYKTVHTKWSKHTCRNVYTLDLTKVCNRKKTEQKKRKKKEKTSTHREGKIAKDNQEHTYQNGCRCDIHISAFIFSFLFSSSITVIILYL